MSENTEKSSSDVLIGTSSNEVNERDRPDGEALSLPTFVAGSGTLDRLVDTARDYARATASDKTLKAYAKDWAHFARWCWMRGTEPLPPSPEMVGLYLADLASGSGPSPALSVSTIDRRLSGLAWNYAQRGFSLDRKNRHIATVLAGIKRKHARPPVQKEAILAEDILAMVATRPTICAGYEIVRSCCSATLEASAAQKSSASTCTRTTQPSPAAGSRSLRKAPS
jgi:hypothetical protein